MNNAELRLVSQQVLRETNFENIRSSAEDLVISNCSYLEAIKRHKRLTPVVTSPTASHRVKPMPRRQTIVTTVPHEF